MDLNQTLSEGIFLKRYKRFFADVEKNNQVITTHVPNTGSLKSCNTPGSPCLFSESKDPHRKIPFTLEAIKVGSTWVGVNTGWPSKIAVNCFEARFFKHWYQFDRLQSEVKISSESRIDLVLWSSYKNPATKIKTTDLSTSTAFHLVEIKNVTLKEDQYAMFPDAVTERGQKHLKELMHAIDQGMTAEMLYIIQRDDCMAFKPARHIDPTYADLLWQAKQKGMIITPLLVKFTKDQIIPLKIIPVEF